MINRRIVLPHVLRLAELDFPAADVERLRDHVRPGTAAFLGPNHPEFMTDWMIDKEVSRRVSPLMAHWASWEIVNVSPIAQGFWLRNNLIANVPGGGGREYSIRWALAGHGVLLHPEGTATWHADRVDRLLPGIVEMAWEAYARARGAGTPRPTFVVPIVWKLHFARDVSAALAREMALIERALGLVDGGALALERRLLALHVGALMRAAGRFEFASPRLRHELPGAEFFAAQDEFAGALRARLEATYGRAEGDSARVLRALRRAIRERQADDPARARQDLAIASEIHRLGGFRGEDFGGPSLTQEQIAESLKQLRTSLVTRGFANALHNTVPRAVAPRVARVRAPDPLEVSACFTDAPEVAEAERARLLERLHERLQGTLDGLNREIATTVDRFRRSNPFALAG